MKSKSVTIADGPINIHFSLREIVTADSVGVGQGYERCEVRQECNSKRRFLRSGNINFFFLIVSPWSVL